MNPRRAESKLNDSGHRFFPDCNFQKCRSALIIMASLVFCSLLQAQNTNISEYNIVWDSQSTDATGSMPLSGGNIGLNAWVEGDDLLFYIGHPDSRTEDGKLIKLGRVRITLTPSPFRKYFRQELDLSGSCIQITGDKTKLTLWIDAFQPVVHIEMESGSPVTATVAFESWRFQAYPVADGLEWHYKSDPEKNGLLQKTKEQGLEEIADQITDPLAGLVMGGRIVCPGLVADGTAEGIYMKTPFTSWKTKTEKPVSNFNLAVLLRVAQDNSVESWRKELDKLQKTPSEHEKTLAFWNEFWNRSWININPGAQFADTAWQVGRNYQLFRYMLAANRTGKAPTLFNGGIFTFDNPLPDATAFDAAGPNPDERAWWGCMFMAQNQRLVYWPMIKTGDTDLLDIGLNFYRDRSALQQARASHLMGIQGTPYNESLDIYGLQAACPSNNGHMGCEHLTYHYTSALDFAYMMVEECRFTGCDITASLPTIMGVLTFYDNLYQKECQKRTGKSLDENGHLVLYPGNSCEMGVGCKNHSDAIAGLRAITNGMLQLPGTDRTWLEGFAKRIPPIPVKEKDDHAIIALAESWEKIANPNEFPQLYTIFPFHQYGVGLPGLELALDTWRYAAFDSIIQKESLCWKQGSIAVADLGLTDEAKAYAVKKFLYPSGNDGATAHYGNCARFKARFPSFWVTYPFDAFPDMDHGGCAMIGLQEMLLQTPGNKLVLLPAWPKEWDVDFKLHAPQNTTVECKVHKGKIVKLQVFPASRTKDIEVIGQWQMDQK